MDSLSRLERGSPLRRVNWPLIWLAVALLSACMITWWPHVLRWLIHAYFALTGAANEPGKTYGFWSGFGGTTLFTALALLPPWYWHHTCHHSAACLRWGEYEAAGGVFKLCRYHHPDLLGQRPHHDLIHRMHREWRGTGDG